MNKAASVFGIALVGTAALFAAAAPAPAPKLKYAVVISRHGVRAPTWTPEHLNEYSSEPWPDFIVPPDYLTPHGRALMKFMGAYYRDWFSHEGLLPASACSVPSRVFIRSDSAERTVETARALGEGLRPKCPIDVHSLAEDEVDPLFDPIGRVARPDPDLAAAALRERLGVPQKLIDAHQPAFDTLQAILSGDGNVTKKVLDGKRTAVTLDGKPVELTGPFDTASALSEDLLLEYANGMQGKDLGWGRLNLANLHQILELHAVYSDLMRQTPYLASAGASNLLVHVLWSMDQAMSGKPVKGALGLPGDALLIISGHDTNLSNIAGTARLTWTLPGYQKDDTPPGGALVFSLWKDAADQYTVKTQYIAQTPDQMHDATALTLTAPPAMQDVAVPGCGPDAAAGCSWSAFERALQKAINPAYTEHP